MAGYFLRIRDGDPVGPHKLDALRDWVARGIISAESMVCRESTDRWIKASEIPRFFEVPGKVKERLAQCHSQSPQSSHAAPATARQIQKLLFFEIFFDEAGLTKQRASELIDAFVHIDSAREEQYQNRPATGAQLAEIRSLIADLSEFSPSEAKDYASEFAEETADSADLTYSEAKEYILELRDKTEKSELAKIDSEYNMDVGMWAECYPWLTWEGVQEAAQHLDRTQPEWRKRDRDDLRVIETVAKLHPQWIEGALRRNRSPADALIQQIRRLGILDKLPANPSDQDAVELLESVCHGPPTGAQLKLAEEVGFKLSDVGAMSACQGRDELLGLGDQPPHQEDTECVQSYGLRIYEADGLGVYVLRCLIRSFEEEDLDFQFDDPLRIARSCLAAMNDPEYRRPALTGDHGGVTVSWPKPKLQEWLRKGSA